MSQHLGCEDRSGLCHLSHHHLSLWLSTLLTESNSSVRGRNCAAALAIQCSVSLNPGPTMLRLCKGCVQMRVLTLALFPSPPPTPIYFDRYHNIHTSNNTSLYLVCGCSHIHGTFVWACTHSGTCEGQRLAMGYVPQSLFHLIF